MNVDCGWSEDGKVYYDVFQVGKPRIPTWFSVEIKGKNDRAYLMMDDPNVDVKGLQTK